MSNNIPDKYKPISMWGYFGYQILFGIPIIGLIFLLIFALGGSSNENVKNYARSYFCVLILSLVFIVIAIACGLGSVAAGILNDWLG